MEEGWTSRDLEVACFRADGGSPARLRSGLASALDVEAARVALVPSGRAGLEVLLGCTDPARPEVLIPAFTCEAVAAAVKAAGRRVVATDLHPVPGHLDVDAVRARLNERVAAVVITHTFGVPVDLRGLLDTARELGVVVIEDGAHALGARIGPRAAGTWGDAAVFSFNRSKPISLGSGGAVVCNRPAAFHRDLLAVLAESAPAARRTLVEEQAWLEGYAGAMRRHRRRFPAEDQRLTHLLRGVRRRVDAVKPRGAAPASAPARAGALTGEGIGPIQAELGLLSLAREPQRRAVRRVNAEVLAARLEHRTWPVAPDTEPCWLQQKVALPSAEVRLAVARELNRRGIRAGNRTWPRLVGVDDGGPVRFPYAQQLADRWLDVPVHHRIDERARELVVTTLSAVPSG